jgi:hypothetical protein
MAETLRRSESLAVAPPHPRVADVRRRLGRSRDAVAGAHRKMFLLAYAVLGLVLGGAAFVAVDFATRPVHKQHAQASVAPALSAGVGTYGLTVLALQVQREYWRTQGNQLLTIVTRPSAPPQLVTATGLVAVSALIVHSGFAIENARDISTYDVSRGALYYLCGTGSACAIPGSASADRGALVEREVLELALRTFQTDASIDSFLAFIPPGSSSSTSARFVFLARGDLSKQLGEPISSALPPLTGPGPAGISPQGRVELNNLVGPHVLVLQNIGQLPDGSAYLEAAPNA